MVLFKLYVNEIHLLHRNGYFRTSNVFNSLFKGSKTMAYSEKQKIKLVNTICDKISSGMALRTVLKEKGMPKSESFYRWIDENDEFSKQYTRATSNRADSIFEDILNISDKQGEDVIILENGNEITNHNIIQRSRLMVDSRKWMLSKMNPKKYGERLNVESPEGTMTPKPSIITTLTEKQLKESLKK